MNYIIRYSIGSLLLASLFLSGCATNTGTGALAGGAGGAGIGALVGSATGHAGGWVALLKCATGFASVCVELIGRRLFRVNCE